jgi:hypothetical protein
MEREVNARKRGKKVGEPEVGESYLIAVAKTPRLAASFWPSL